MNEFKDSGLKIVFCAKELIFDCRLTSKEKIRFATNCDNLGNIYDI